MKFEELEMPEKFPITDWKKVFDRIIDFEGWTEKWKRIGELQRNKNKHEE